MSKTSKSTQENKPPAWAQPMFEKSASDAMDLYNSGSGGNTWMGSTVAPLSGTTMEGVNQLAQAGANWNTAGDNPVGGSAAAANLGDMASGKWLKEGNPYFNDALRGQLDDTAAQVQSQFSGAGRYGSGANTGVLTNRLGNIRASALSDQFNRDTQNQITATGMLDQQRNMGLDRLQQNFQNRLAGAGATLQAGGILDQQSQAQLGDQVQKFYALDNQDWNRLAMLQSAAAGAAGNYGTQNSTQRTPVNIAGALGGMMSGKSDIRLKEDIEPVGERNGLKLYEFAYVGQPERYVGVMAQELPMGDPALILEDDGFFAVDYGQIGFAMERVA